MALTQRYIPSESIFDHRSYINFSADSTKDTCREVGRLDLSSAHPGHYIRPPDVDLPVCVVLPQPSKSPPAIATDLEKIYSNGIETSDMDAPPLPHAEYLNTDHVPFECMVTLGHGSFSRVEKVKQKVSGEVFARKLFRITGATAKQFLPIVQQEVNIMKRLQHHHIVAIHCTYQAPRFFGIILSPVADGDLESFMDRMTEEGFPDERDKLTIWFGCLAGALAYIHGKGIRHGDIKPKNIIYKGSQVWFTDFGSSREISLGLTSSTEGYVFGHTKMYSAPEVISESRRGRSADIFSLGCVFAEMQSIVLGMSLSDFYEFREGNGGGYHATLVKVDQWFNYARLAKIDPWVDLFDYHLGYWQVIKPMLNVGRKERPTALQVLRAAKDHISRLDLGHVICDPCTESPIP